MLVERVEGYCTPSWQRAYQEINEFERARRPRTTDQILDPHLPGRATPPLPRTRRLPDKSWKTEEDWRNRGKWADHLEAVAEMIRRELDHAPWTIVEANDKLHARVKVVRTVERALREGLAREGASASDRPAARYPSG